MELVRNIHNTLFSGWKELPLYAEDGKANDPTIWHQAKVMETEQKCIRNCIVKDHELYRHDTQDWAFAKNLGLIVTLPYLSFIRAIGGLGLECQQFIQELKQNIKEGKVKEKLAQKSLSFRNFFVKPVAQSYTDFAKEKFSSISKAHPHLMRIGKDFALFACFKLIDYNFFANVPIVNYLSLGCGPITYAFVIHSLIFPYASRTILNRWEHSRRQENTKQLMDYQIQKLSALQNFKAFIDGSYTLNHFFRMDFYGTLDEFKDLGRRFKIVSDKEGKKEI